MSNLGIVTIGRNEGERLRSLLEFGGQAWPAGGLRRFEFE